MRGTPFSKEIMRYAVSKVLNDKVRRADVCNEVGCGSTSLNRWIHDYQRYGEAIFAEDGSYYVYMHTTPSKPRKKVYIGITRQNPYNRWHNGTSYKKNTNQYFWNAIQKYGWENIDHKILEYGLTEEEAKKREVELIKQYHAKDRKYGYNLTDGGDGCHGIEVNVATRKRISKAHKGRKHSDIHNKRVSIAKGYPVKQFSLEGDYIQTFYSTAEAARQLGMPSSHQSHISACCNGMRHHAAGYRWCWESDECPVLPLKGEPCNNRAVSQYHLDGRYIATFKSLKEAGEAVSNASKPGDNIQACCIGKTKYAYGFIWKYADDHQPRDIDGLKGHPQYGKVKEFLKNHNKAETAKEFDIPLPTLCRYLQIAERKGISDDECLQS